MFLAKLHSKVSLRIILSLPHRAFYFSVETLKYSILALLLLPHGNSSPTFILRLQEDHSKLNQLNQELESKIITVIQTAESEKQASATRAQVAEEKLEKAEALIKQLTVECAKYKNDCQVVAQLLHTNPDNFLQPNSDLGEHGLEASSGCGGKVERTPSGYTKPLLDKQDVESPQYILPTFPPIALPPESSLFVHRQKVFTDSAVSASNVETPATSKMGGVFQI
ncbi:hypothetical protein AAHC03_01202 [Spirometra sp. Aus1]